MRPFCLIPVVILLGFIVMGQAHSNPCGFGWGGDPGGYPAGSFGIHHYRYADGRYHPEPYKYDPHPYVYTYSHRHPPYFSMDLGAHQGQTPAPVRRFEPNFRINYRSMTISPI